MASKSLLVSQIFGKALRLLSGFGRLREERGQFLRGLGQLRKCGIDLGGVEGLLAANHPVNAAPVALPFMSALRCEIGSDWAIAIVTTAAIAAIASTVRIMRLLPLWTAFRAGGRDWRAGLKHRIKFDIPPGSKGPGRDSVHDSVNRASSWAAPPAAVVSWRPNARPIPPGPVALARRDG